MANVGPWGIAAFLLTLIPVFGFGFAGEKIAQALARMPLRARVLLPMVFALPYLVLAGSHGIFHVGWFLLYLIVPCCMAVVELFAAQLDPEQRGHWLDALLMVPLGLAVDLRWFRSAWPPGGAVIGKLILLDAALYAIMGLRRLSGVGFSLRLRFSDLGTGIREFLFYAVLALPVGIALKFIELHHHVAHPHLIAPIWLTIFFGVALPEEIFFRGWVQNLLERRIGARWALIVTSILFGLSHFNKRRGGFNWQYIIMAAVAGVFYGRAWRRNRRVGASAIAHATTDTIWGALFWSPY